MRIGIDCSCAAKPERTGVARYCASLVAELPHVLGEADRVVLLHRFSRAARRRWFLAVDDPRFAFGWLNDKLLRVAPSGLDVVHGPDLRIPDLAGTPCVSTVHDLSALDLPGIAGERFRQRKLAALEHVARRAAVILCVSEFTREAFLRRFPAAADRTRVVPHAIGAQFRPQDPERVREVVRSLGIRAPYLLFVGQISARKNLLPLVDAFARLHAESPAQDLDLVLAGPVQHGGDDVTARIAELPVAHRVRLPGYLGDAQLPALYAGAAAFVFPGKAEGFGLPILEAMACGCPVLAADAGANASTAAGAAVLFDPDDAAALAAALRRIVAPGAERDELIARGTARAAGSTWRETARRTVDAYRDAALIGSRT